MKSCFAPLWKGHVFLIWLKKKWTILPGWYISFTVPCKVLFVEQVLCTSIGFLFIRDSKTGMLKTDFLKSEFLWLFFFCFKGNVLHSLNITFKLKKKVNAYYAKLKLFCTWHCIWQALSFFSSWILKACVADSKATKQNLQKKMEL